MIKRFCDCCGLELIGDRELFGRRLTGSVPAHQCVSGYRMIFEITTGLDNTWNDGDFCKYCIINSVRSMDDRPQVTTDLSRKDEGTGGHSAQAAGESGAVSALRGTTDGYVQNT